MVFNSSVCFYKQSSKCYWIIGLLVCVNVWLISKLKPSQNLFEETRKDTSQSTTTAIVKKLDTLGLTANGWNIMTPNEAIKNSSDNTGLEHIFESEIINVDLGRFDLSRKYKMYDNVIVGEKFVNLSIDYDVTLATQSSLHKLHWISHIAR